MDVKKEARGKMAKNTFIVYEKIYDMIKDLPSDLFIRFSRAIFEYGFYGEIPEFETNSLCEFWKELAVELDKEKQRKGENSPNWKGGITPENKRIRASKEYKMWRAKVFNRDEFTCQICGQVGGILNAHHIKRFAKDKENRFNVDNGITLCNDCHKYIHRMEGK